MSQPKWYVRVWVGIKKFTFKYVGALFMEPKGMGHGASLGRTSFLGLLLYFVHYWSAWVGRNPDATALPPGMMEVFYVCAAWVGVTKGKEAVASLASRKKQPTDK